MSSTQALSDAEIQRRMNILARNRFNQTMTAMELRCARSTVQQTIAMAKQRGIKPEYPMRFGSTATDPVNGISDQHALAGTSTLYRIDDGAGSAVLQWVKTQAGAGASALTEALRDFFEGYEGRAEPAPPPISADADLLRLYTISDFHLSMYAWGAESGEDYDMELAEAILHEAVSDLVERSAPAETAVVLALGDFFHADNSSNQTMRSGHALDVDTRYSRVARLGVKLMVECVEIAAAKHKNVIVRCIPGNHDDHSAIWLAIALDAFFDDHPRVTVDIDPSLYWRFLFGRTLIAGAHGDKASMKDAAGIMAAMWPEEWGASAFRYFHFGHIHHKRVFPVHERHAVMVESHQTIAAKDAWSYGQGHISTRAMTAITYHREFGERTRDTYSIPYGTRNREWLKARSETTKAATGNIPQ